MRPALTVSATRQRALVSASGQVKQQGKAAKLAMRWQSVDNVESLAADVSGTAGMSPGTDAPGPDTESFSTKKHVDALV